MLQYIVKLVKENDPDLLKVREEMPSIGPAVNVIFDSLDSELKVLNEQLAHVKKTAETDGKRVRAERKAVKETLCQQETKIKDVEGVSICDQAAAVNLTEMEIFVKCAEERNKEAFAQIDEVQEQFKGVLTYFRDPAMTYAGFFGTLNTFVAAFDSASEVVKRTKSLKTAKEKREAARRSREATKNAAQRLKGKLDLRSGQGKQSADREFIIVFYIFLSRYFI